MDIPSLFMIPSAVSSGKVHSVFPNSTDADFDFARSSTATRVNSDGLIETVASGQARLNYEIEGGLVNTKPSLLLEPSSTNTITYSENFSQWTIDGQTSVVSNSIISPDGTLNATKLIAGSTSARQAIKLSNTSTGNLAISVFAKKGEYTTLQFTDGRQAQAFVNFDLNNGVVGSSNTMNGQITNLGNNWYRCVATYNSPLNMNNLKIAIAESPTSVRLAQFSGNDSDGLYIYGAQVEVLSYPTSYIPTNGSTQTRAAETCNGAGTSSILPSEEGILYAEIAALANDGTERQISLSDGSSSTNKVSILYTSTTNQIKAFVRGGGSVSLNATHTLSNALQFNKIALKYKVNDFSLYVNGTEVLSDTSGAIPTALSDLSLDDADGTQDFYGKIRDIRVYNTKEMTDSEVDILLTKITS